jgi:hypothetical protein
MTILMIGSLAVFLFFLFLVVMRLASKSGVEPVGMQDVAGDRRSPDHARAALKFEASYQEALNLGDVELERGESVLAGCGTRGEIESVLLATNQRLLVMTRRFGASRYHVETFDYVKLHPIPLGQAVIGEHIRIMEEDRMVEMTSPGAESWLDTAEDTIKIINTQIRKSHAKK